MARASPSCSVPLRVFWALSSGWYHIPALAQCSERGIPQQQKTKTPTQPMDQGAHLSRFKKQLSQVTRRHIYIYICTNWRQFTDPNGGQSQTPCGPTSQSIFDHESH